MVLGYIGYSLFLSVFLGWFLGWKPAGIVMKAVCAVHILWSVCAFGFVWYYG